MVDLFCASKAMMIEVLYGGMRNQLCVELKKGAKMQAWTGTNCSPNCTRLMKRITDAVPPLQHEEPDAIEKTKKDPESTWI
jgi:hypothetical protein